ncbi:MAG: aspartate aminotransferase family protein [Promethearchaeota archaeon]
MELVKKGMKVVQRDRKAIGQALRLAYYPVVAVHAEGSTVWDKDGNGYIDFLGGAAALPIGHRHPAVVNAIKEQADQLIHHPPLYGYHELAVDLAEKLNQLPPGDFSKKTIYQLAGAAAMDLTVKLVRVGTRRTKIITFLKGYYGALYGALSLSAFSTIQRRYLGPFIPEVYHVPFADCYRCIFKQEYPDCGLVCLDYLKTVLKHLVPPDEVAAIITEPVGSDGGYIFPPPEWLKGLQEICQDYDMLFALDEIQTGCGRCGSWFLSSEYDLTPDLVAFGKGFSAGVPLSGVIGRATVMDELKPPSAIGTGIGNPIACAVALAVIEVIKKENLIRECRKMGSYLKKRLEEMKKDHPLIGQIRGKGMLIGVDLVKDPKTREPARLEASKVCWRSGELGLILTTLGESVLRICPAYNLSQEEANKALEIIDNSLSDVEKGKIPDKVVASLSPW